MKASSDKKHRFFCFQKENNYLCTSKLHDIGFNQLVIKGVINDIIMKKLVLEKDWDYSIYNVNGKKIISVVFCNSFVDYSRSFFLRKEEECYGFEEFAILAQKIRDNVTKYEDREIVPTL